MPSDLGFEIGIAPVVRIGRPVKIVRRGSEEVLSMVKLQGRCFKGIDDDTDGGQIFRTKSGMDFMPETDQDLRVRRGSVFGLRKETLSKDIGFPGRSDRLLAARIECESFILPAQVLVFT